MTKQLSPLEALSDLREVKGWNETEFNKRLDIIETALKDYEELQKDYCKVVEERGKWQKETQKKLKALEIIKEQTKYFIDFDENTKTIYIDCALDCDAEQFDLLKEVLK